MNREAANVKKLKDSLASPAVVAIIDAISDTSSPDSIVSVFAEFPFDSLRADVTARLDQLADPETETSGEPFELRELITDEIKTYVQNTGPKIIDFFTKVQVESNSDSQQVEDMALSLAAIEKLSNQSYQVQDMQDLNTAGTILYCLVLCLVFSFPPFSFIV